MTSTQNSVEHLGHDPFPFPIRCFTCGKVVAKHARAWMELRSKPDCTPAHQAHFLDTHKYRRICCRRMFLSQPLHGKHLEACATEGIHKIDDSQTLFGVPVIR